MLGTSVRRVSLKETGGWFITKTTHKQKSKLIKQRFTQIKKIIKFETNSHKT